jgi:receptor-binding and translocation channel-forming TcA subunit of Tc toxin
MAKFETSIGFHDEVRTAAASENVVRWENLEKTPFTYKFENFFHPFVDELIAKLNRDSLPGILDATWQESLSKLDPDFFRKLYNPINSDTVKVVSFPKEIDLAVHGSYASYNWELFFHIPLTIAVHLGKNQRFGEAQRWFHYIFDPTCSDTSIPTPQRFWKFLAFRQNKNPTQIDQLLKLLSDPTTDPTVRRTILEGYQAILNNPFQPHVVARTRHLAYQYCVVMKYLDNLIAWGDHLFQQDTTESINEATQRYVLAANLLGPRPQRIPGRGRVQPKTFAQLKKKGLDPMGNALTELEGEFPFNLDPVWGGGEGAGVGPLFGIGRTLYFCIPRNEKMLGYWDTVAERLFKIRHCMNIKGIVRPLDLFDPPIDPGMLVKAAAAGIDVGSIVSGLNQPIGPVRSLILIQKALELASEVRGLGNALLAALEKGDGEHLALLRQSHEVELQKKAKEVRFLQRASAQHTTNSLIASRGALLERLHYYKRLLGLPKDPNEPDTVPVDFEKVQLTEEDFAKKYNGLVGLYDKPLTLQALPPLQMAADSTTDGLATLSSGSRSGRLYLNTNEDVELNKHLPQASELRSTASTISSIASVLTFIPDLDVKLAFWGLGAGSRVFGGSKMSDALKIGAGIMSNDATSHQEEAAMASRTALYDRRADDWIHQHNLAAHELMQIGRQILASLIAEQIAYHEYLNLEKQIEKAAEMESFLKNKFTNENLYLWMQGEISRLYYEYYRFAFDTARKAERTMKQELMRPELDAQDFVKLNYWDGGRKGLLSGEALYLDVKRLELAYHDNNKRELEVTKHVSLRQLNPLALLTLKATGSCTVTIPEWLYDRDCPGHYMRRIKSVALSIPSVVGPYTSVNCTLSLLKSSLRKSPSPKDGEYARQGSEDDRFADYTGAMQSIVTSTGQSDSGLFETNLRDERFLPFENAGAESTWKLDLPKDYPAFDYATISDVILHIRYTARQGVDPTKVKKALDDLFKEANQTNLALLFSLRHDFPTEWSKFVTTDAPFAAAIRRDYFPYFTQGKKIKIVSMDVYSGVDVTKNHPVDDVETATTNLTDHDEFTLTAGPDSEGPTQVLSRTGKNDVFLIIRYELNSE